MLEVRLSSVTVSICCVLVCILWLKCCFGVVNSDLKRRPFLLPPNNNENCAPRKFQSLFICDATDRVSNDVILSSEQCKRGFFILKGMSSCHSWLKCEDYLNDIILIGLIGHGAVKQVYKGMWKGHHLVAVSIPHVVDGQIIHLNDFVHGHQMLQELGPSKHLIQFVGYCDGDPPVIITEYHRYGSANNVQEIFRTFPQNNLATRFRLCLNYVEILSWLHSSPIGVRVMCDTNDLKKTLEQYLLTNELRLVLNDVDALPEVDRSSEKLVKCGHKRLYGEFVAPEQLWPHTDREYDDREMYGYDERSDVWKIPDVCDFFLSTFDNESEKILLSYRLFRIHGKCKTFEPEGRPTAKDVFKEYRNIWFELYDNRTI